MFTMRLIFVHFRKKKHKELYTYIRDHIYIFVSTPHIFILNMFFFSSGLML